MADPFISVTDLEAIMETDLDDSSLLVAIALDSACTAVRTYLQQEVNYTAEDELTLDGTGTDVLRLPERPVREVTTVTEDGEELDPEDTWMLQGSRLIRLDGLTWRRGRGNYVVTYSHGWDTEDSSDALPVPADIRLVALLLARRIFNASGEESGGEQSETIGAYSYTLSDPQQKAAQLLEPETAVLSRYKFRKVP